MIMSWFYIFSWFFLQIYQYVDYGDSVYIEIFFCATMSYICTFNQTLMGWCLWVPFQKLIGYHKLSHKRATISEYWTDSFIWNYLTNFPDFELAWLKSGWAVMYCPASTVHLLAILIFIFCWKYWDNMNQTWQERSLGSPHSKLNLIGANSIQDGHHY
jgi:hypothetical protein